MVLKLKEWVKEKELKALQNTYEVSEHTNASVQNFQNRISGFEASQISMSAEPADQTLKTKEFAE